MPRRNRDQVSPHMSLRGRGLSRTYRTLNQRRIRNPRFERCTGREKQPDSDPAWQLNPEVHILSFEFPVPLVDDNIAIGLTGWDHRKHVFCVRHHDIQNVTPF